MFNKQHNIFLQLVETHYTNSHMQGKHLDLCSLQVVKPHEVRFLTIVHTFGKRLYDIYISPLR